MEIARLISKQGVAPVIVDFVCPTKETREAFGFANLVIWVDASGRLPEEPSTSFNITKSDADIIIENNGSFEEFKEKAKKIGSVLFKKFSVDKIILS